MVYYMDLYYTMPNYPAIKINVRKYRRDKYKMDNPETWQHGIHNTKKCTTQYVLDTTIRKQIQKT
jgi:hypothetical protein